MKEILTPLADAADDHTMRFSGRFERVRDVSRQLERDRHELIGALHQILLDEKRDDDDPLLIETRVMCNSLLERMKP